MLNVQTISSSHVPVWLKEAIIPASGSVVSGKYRLYTRDAVIRIRRPVARVWESWTSRSFWKCFFSYEDFEGEFCPASEFFARGSRNGQSFREHGEFSVVQEELALRYHVWHWGKNADHDGDSSVTVTFKALGDGSTKILVLQSWKLLAEEADPSFDWNVRLESIRLFLENICA
jgi:uncharacterized protein YndB with AHSA1/START domain